jgi:hypothetical protein
MPEMKFVLSSMLPIPTNGRSLLRIHLNLFLFVTVNVRGVVGKQSNGGWSIFFYRVLFPGLLSGDCAVQPGMQLGILLHQSLPAQDWFFFLGCYDITAKFVRGVFWVTVDSDGRCVSTVAIFLFCLGRDV